MEVEVLAEMLGINVRNMRRRETGASTMNPAVAERLEALSEQAGVVVDEMLADLEGQNAPAVTICRSNVELWAVRPDLRPLTVGWHRGVVARVLDELPHLEVDYSLATKRRHPY